MANKLKKIIFCQGDKKELEEITGEEYEYLKPEEITAAVPKFSKNHIPLTYIEATFCGRDIQAVKSELYNAARKLNADAVIHYNDGITKIGGGQSIMENYSYAKGTPLRRKDE